MLLFVFSFPSFFFLSVYLKRERERSTLTHALAVCFLGLLFLFCGKGSPRVVADSTGLYDGVGGSHSTGRDRERKGRRTEEKEKQEERSRCPQLYIIYRTPIPTSFFFFLFGASLHVCVTGSVPCRPSSSTDPHSFFFYYY